MKFLIIILLLCSFNINAESRLWIGAAMLAKTNDATLQNPIGEFGLEHDLIDSESAVLFVYGEHKSGMFATEQTHGYNAIGMRLGIKF